MDTITKDILLSCKELEEMITTPYPEDKGNLIFNKLKFRVIIKDEILYSYNNKGCYYEVNENERNYNNRLVTILSALLSTSIIIILP